MVTRTVLIVEDDDHLGSILLRSIGRLGHAVQLAPTLAEARRALAAMTPEVLLLDVDLPDGTGWELLREQPAAASAIIVMSAGQPARRRLAEFPAASFLNKPFAMDTLLDLIERGGASATDAGAEDSGVPLAGPVRMEDP
jgi:DNA-binding response OmpR family regulator